MDEKIKRALYSLCESCATDLQEQLLRWHDYMAFEKHASAHTLYNYILDFKSFIEFLQQHMGKSPDLDLLKTIQLTSFRSFLAYRVQKNCTAQSNKRALSALKCVYGFLEKNCDIRNVYLKELSTPKSGKTLPRPASYAHIQNFMDSSTFRPEQPQWIHLRDEALYMLLYGCGLRIQEALNLDIGHIHSQSILVTGKRNKQRVVPLMLPVYAKIQNYLELRPGHMEKETPLFIGIQGGRLNARVIQKQMEKIRISLGIPDTSTPHSLRHSFASHMLAGGADLRSIQELMGHDSLSSTQVYTQLEDDSLFDSVLKSHPRSKTAK